MFKRVARRQKRKEDEEELGLNEEMKEVMGLQDTDSSESDSSSGDDSTNEEAGTTKKSLPMKRKRNAGSDEEDGVDDASDSAAEDDEVAENYTDDEELIGLGDVDAEDSGDDEPLMTVSQALKDPLYLVSMDPETRACVVCPGKVLKVHKMIEIHMSSNAHKRRFKRLRELAMATSPDADVGDILVELEKEKEDSEDSVAQSKRAQKRRAKQATLRAKRLKQKEARAKAAARKKEKQALVGEMTSLTDSTSPVPKKAIKEKQDRKTTSTSPTKKPDRKQRPRYVDEAKPVETKPSNTKQGEKKMKGSPKKRGSGHNNQKKTTLRSAEKQRSKKRPKPNQAELQVFD